MGQYKLTQKLLIRMMTRFGDRYRCNKCGSPFEVGDIVISRTILNMSGRHVAKWYHKKCWEDMHL